MADALCIYIDEAGTLSKNPKNPDFFIYAGFWCLSSQSDIIAANFGRVITRYFPSAKNGERKASTIKRRKKMLVLKDFIAVNEDFHTVFVMEKLSELHQPLRDKEEKQLHKNYLLRRFVEDCIKDFRHTGQSAESVNVFIDDQPKTKLHGRDDFAQYLRNHLRDKYFSPSYTTSSAKISVAFKDSNYDRRIQLCDILANSKYEHYVRNRNDVELALKDSSVCHRKLP